MICYPVVGGRILLGMKKRGFGVGRWNGFGGKLEPGEDLMAATRRELVEEAGITVVNLDIRGLLLAKDEDGSLLRHVQLMVSDRFLGTPQESEEMRPQWFGLDELPFESMWPNDNVWMPRLLAGERLLVVCCFDQAGEMVRIDVSSWEGQ
jgi:8-oxo-dGTP pyrophosphatase MutT (NUDIX family)